MKFASCKILNFQLAFVAETCLSLALSDTPKTVWSRHCPYVDEPLTVTLATQAGLMSDFTHKCLIFEKTLKKKRNASAGNRTRAARVAGEHSTTEPPMLMIT